MNKLEKVYAVEFMQYTNCLNDTVCDWDGSYSTSLKNHHYLDVGKEVVLIKESDLEKYRKYGQGYRNCEFVGNIIIDE